jgi:DNA-binding transcriptional regulator YiaG
MTIWRSVPGYAGIYDISDDGQIARIATHGIEPKKILRLLKPHKKPNGYLATDLQVGQERYRSYVHRLVYRAFRGEIPIGLEINHLDGDKSNNNLSNLELVTRSANMTHSFQNLDPSRNRVRGAEHHKAKLSEEKVAEIKRLRKSGLSRGEVAGMFGVSKTAIYYVEIGKNWKHARHVENA